MIAHARDAVSARRPTVDFIVPIVGFRWLKNTATQGVMDARVCILMTRLLKALCQTLHPLYVPIAASTLHRGGESCHLPLVVTNAWLVEV